MERNKEWGCHLSTWMPTKPYITLHILSLLELSYLQSNFNHTPWLPQLALSINTTCQHVMLLIITLPMWWREANPLSEMKSPTYGIFIKQIVMDPNEIAFVMEWDPVSILLPFYRFYPLNNWSCHTSQSVSSTWNTTQTLDNEYDMKTCLKVTPPLSDEVVSYGGQTFHVTPTLLACHFDFFLNTCLITNLSHF